MRIQITSTQPTGDSIIVARSHVVAHLVRQDKRQGAARVLKRTSQHYLGHHWQVITHVGPKAVSSRDRRVV